MQDIQRILPNKKFSKYIQYFEQSLPEELQIYHRVILLRQGPISPLSALTINSSHINLLFALRGDLEGYIVCRIHQKNEDATPERYSLYSETLNILIGKFLTNLEEHGIMSLIGEPKVIEHHSGLKKYFSKHPIELTTQFLLKTDNEFCKCDLVICVNINKVMEV